MHFIDVINVIVKFNWPCFIQCLLVIAVCILSIQSNFRNDVIFFAKCHFNNFSRKPFQWHPLDGGFQFKWQWQRQRYWLLLLLLLMRKFIRWFEFKNKNTSLSDSSNINCMRIKLMQRIPLVMIIQQTSK